MASTSDLTSPTCFYKYQKVPTYPYSALAPDAQGITYFLGSLAADGCAKSGVAVLNYQYKRKPPLIGRL
jgi:hypothetical protein